MDGATTLTLAALLCATAAFAYVLYGMGRRVVCGDDTACVDRQLAAIDTGTNAVSFVVGVWAIGLLAISLFSGEKISLLGIFDTFSGAVARAGEAVKRAVK